MLYFYNFEYKYFELWKIDSLYSLRSFSRKFYVLTLGYFNTKFIIKLLVSKDEKIFIT